MMPKELREILLKYVKGTIHTNPNLDLDVIFYSQEEVDDILNYVKCNLVQHFEETLQPTNIDAYNIHKKITDYNREKFNILFNKYSQTSDME